MKAKEIRYFKKQLTLWLEDLGKRADAAIAELRESNVGVADPLEQAALEYGRNFSIRIHDRESQLIRKIRHSLRKIEEGTFGTCELCQEPIAIERLRARPIASHCIACKSRLENLERAYASGTGFDVGAIERLARETEEDLEPV